MESVDSKREWKPSSPEVLGGDLNGVLERNPVVAIHFWAPWNGYDRQLDPAIRAASEHFEGRVRFFSMDTDRADNASACERISEHFHCHPASSLALFHHKTMLKPIFGVRSSEDLVSEIELLLSAREVRQQRQWWAFWR